jgi:hypothetical protein
MILKLIKHELKATLPNLSSVFIALFSLAVLGPILLNFNTEFLNVIIVLASFSAVIAVVIVTFMVIINLFNKRTFSNEGYLNLTLPVTTTQLLLSKLLSAIIISVITSVGSFLAFLVFILSASWTVYGGLEPLSSIISEISDSGLFAKLGESLLSLSLLGATDIVYAMSILLFVIVFVHTSYVRKNKLVVAVISILGINFLLGYFEAFVLTSELFVFGGSPEVFEALIIGGTPTLTNIVDTITIEVDWAGIGMLGLFYLVMAGIFFTLAQYLMEHKLEVE